MTVSKNSGDSNVVYGLQYKKASIILLKHLVLQGQNFHQSKLLWSHIIDFKSWYSIMKLSSIRHSPWGVQNLQTLKVLVCITMLQYSLKHSPTISSNQTFIISRFFLHVSYMYRIYLGISQAPIFEAKN